MAVSRTKNIQLIFIFSGVVGFTQVYQEALTLFGSKFFVVLAVIILQVYAMVLLSKVYAASRGAGAL